MNELNVWLEKYNPTSLDGIVGQKNIVNLLRGYVRMNNMPHLMFAGLPGIGKTTAATVLAKELFGDNWKSNIIMMNASDERGIDIIRGKIKDATRYAPIDGNFKIIFLDESDELTESAQRALRETMIKHQNITRFIFSVNNIGKMIEPIQDRCQILRFKSLSMEDIRDHLKKIIKKEKIDISSANVSLIAGLSKGSMRKAMNALQSISYQDEINETLIREAMDITFDPQHAKQLLDLVIKGNIEIYEKYLFELIYKLGFQPSEILQGLMDLLISKNDPKLLSIIVVLAEYDWRISQGAQDLLQLRCGLMKLSQSKVMI